MNFIDLQKQYQTYKDEIQSAITSVLEKASFIKGPFLVRFEENLARHSGAKHAIGCSSGTDAIILALAAKDIKPGDEIIIPDFTFIATAETVAFMGAVPVFVDVLEDTYNIDPSLIEKKITERTKGIIPVSLYGQCADFDEICQIADKHNLWVVEDGAQSYGAEYMGKKSCTITEIGTTSFFPAKPLGCYGDGGAVFTNDDESADRMRVLLNHGQVKRYHHDIIGINGRLDALQAAILDVKLNHFDKEMEKKREIADLYTQLLDGVVITPTVKPENVSVWAQYTVRTPERDRVTAHVKEQGIPTAVHYPIPLHRQNAFSYIDSVDEEFPVTNTLCNEVFSLPMHPFLTDAEVRQIADAVKEAVNLTGKEVVR